jgi:hypothetical protein
MKLANFVSSPTLLFITLMVPAGLPADSASLPRTNDHDKAPPTCASALGQRFDDTNQLQHALAYEQAAARRMLAEVNFYVERLNLPESQPVKNASARVNPPWFGGLGAVETKDFLYSFVGSDRKPITNQHGAEGFLEHGKLAYIIRKEPFALLTNEVGDDFSALTEKLSKIPSQIDTNQAYQLATQWLAAADVDLAALEKRHLPLVEQHFVYSGPITWEFGKEPPPNTPKKLLPIFDVTWGGASESSPPVSVEIYGPTKELIHLRMEDTRYSKRQPIVITNELAEFLNTLDPLKKALAMRQPLVIPQAYKEAATALMLKEADFLVEKLGLDAPKPLLSSQVVANVSPPFTHELGSLVTDDFEFHFTGADEKPDVNDCGGESFAEPGKLIGLTKRKPWQKYENEDGNLNEQFFQLPSLIDTNGAYQLATQWLSAIEVDVPALEKKYRPMSVQAEFGTVGGLKRKAPVFSVTWGAPHDQRPVVSVHIFGATRELVYLSMSDTRFSRRAAIVVRDK